MRQRQVTLVSNSSVQVRSCCVVDARYGRQTADGNVIFGGDRVRCAGDDYEVDAEVCFSVAAAAGLKTRNATGCTFDSVFMDERILTVVVPGGGVQSGFCVRAGSRCCAPPGAGWILYVDTNAFEIVKAIMCFAHWNR